MRKIMSIVAALVVLSLSGCSQEEGNGTVVIPGKEDNKEQETSDVKVGSPLPAWEEGEMDIHFINTTTGECMFLILPDGTQMMIDAAGSEVATGAVNSTTNTGQSESALGR